MHKGRMRSLAASVALMFAVATTAQAHFLQPDPSGTKAGPNLYEYALDNPVSGIDPDGRTVVWVVGPNNQAAAAQSQAYLMQSSTYAGNYRQLEQSPNTYRFIPTAGAHDDFDPVGLNVRFDLNSGLVLKSGGVESPALNQAHEVDHAAERDRVGYDAFHEALGRSVSVAPGGPDEFVVTRGVAPEEKRATTSTDRVARELGEPIQGKYSNGVGFQPLASPTQHVCPGSSSATSGPC